MSWLFLLNFFVFQWTGFRLAKVFDADTGIQIGWTWTRMWPLTGWKLHPSNLSEKL